MEEEIRVDKEFKKAFNMGYRVAQELNLKTQILREHEKLVPNNPIHLGMQQYIDEAKLSVNISKKKSLGDTIKKKNGKSRGKGPSL